MPKKTPAQTFAAIFARWTQGATPPERAIGERKVDAWLKRNEKTRADIPALLAQAVKDDEAANPPSPPSDPRDAAPNPFVDPEFTPTELVDGILRRYVIAKSDDLFTVLALWVPFGFIYLRFRVAPRIALTGDTETGKSTLVQVLRHLVFRPNKQVQGTGATIRDCFDDGPVSVLLDEMEFLDADERRVVRKIWNIGHERGAMISLKVGGKTKYINVHAPMLVAGINLAGMFLGPAQLNRAFLFEMERSADDPPCKIDDGFDDIDAVHTFLFHWARKVGSGKIKLNPNPQMPRALRRFGDNIRGLLAVADACGWGQRARATFLRLYARILRSALIFVCCGMC